VEPFAFFSDFRNALCFGTLDALLQIVNLLRVQFDLPAQFRNASLSRTTTKAGKR